jgi:ATP-dependent Zn protease
MKARSYLPDIDITLETKLKNSWDGARTFMGRGKEYRATARVMFTYQLSKDRWEVYRACVRQGIEELVLNEISTGAQNDLERATQIARKMVMEFGMSENIGPMTLGHKHEEVFLGRDLTQGRNYSEEVAASIDKEVRSIIEKCYDTAKRLLSENINKLHKVAQALLEREKLDEEEFLEVFANA